jgi:hypothetical protein
MTTDTRTMTWFLLGALLVGVSVLALHERHYRSRRDRIGDARTAGETARLAALELRLGVVEEILVEHRDK